MPSHGATTSACDWRITDLVDTDRPVSLYLVIPPSDISRTKPLVRLVLNRIGRRLTERLEGDPAKSRKHHLLMMLDEFPALDSTPERSFSDLFRTSRAAEATTGCTTGFSLVPIWFVAIMARSVCSKERRGSDRKVATRARVFSSSA